MYFMNWESVSMLIAKDAWTGIKKILSLLFFGVGCWAIDHFGVVDLGDDLMVTLCFTVAALICMLIGMIGHCFFYYRIVAKACCDYPNLNIMSAEGERALMDMLETMEEASEDAE